MYRITRACLQVSLLAVGFLLAVGAVLGIAQAPGLVVLLIGAAIWYGKRRGFSGDGWTFGSARVADHRDLASAGYLAASTGLLVGTVGRISKGQAIRLLFKLPYAETACRLFFSATEKRDLPVRLTHGVHTLICAPPGAGKGVSLIVPHLLMYRGSAVVVDPKGELYTLTHRARRKMGHQIVVLDPFGISGAKNSDTLNPLSLIDPNDPSALDWCKSLAESLVIRTGKEQEPHWSDSAEIFIAALCALVVARLAPDYRHLQSVATALASPKQLAGCIKAMQEGTEYGGMLSRLGDQLAHYADREKASVLTTANRACAFLASPQVVANTMDTSFDPQKLRTGKMTAYLVLPAQYLRSHSALLRMWISTFLRVVVSGGANEKNKVLFLIDEAAQLRRMQCVEDALNLGRGYGLRLLTVWQSLSQIKECMPEGQDATYLAAHDNQIYFGVNDLETAKRVSEMVGQCTVANVTVNDGEGSGTSVDGHGLQSSSRNRNSGSSVAQVGRPVFHPEEILKLERDVAITFAPHCPVILTRLVPYYTRTFRKLRGQAGWLMCMRSFALAVLSVGMAAMTVAGLAQAQHRRQPQMQVAPFNGEGNGKGKADWRPGFEDGKAVGHDGDLRRDVRDGRGKSAGRP